MSATLTPSTAADRAGKSRPKRSAPPNVTGPALKGLAIFVVLAAFGLGIALVAGATSVFNVVVWLLFTVLWVAFVGALAFSPATLDEVWQAARRPAILIQAVVWLLFLPIMAGLWIWQRPWAAAIRLMLLPDACHAEPDWRSDRARRPAYVRRAAQLRDRHVPATS